MKVNILNKRMATFVAILFAYMIYVSIYPYIAYGSTGGTDGSKSTAYLYDSDGRVSGYIVMSQGEIEVVNNANAASNAIRFRTIGLNISLDPLASMSYTYTTTTDKYHLQGFKGIDFESDAIGNGGMMIEFQGFEWDKVTEILDTLPLSEDNVDSHINE